MRYNTLLNNVKFPICNEVLRSLNLSYPFVAFVMKSVFRPMLSRLDAVFLCFIENELFLLSEM